MKLICGVSDISLTICRTAKATQAIHAPAACKHY